MTVSGQELDQMAEVVDFAAAEETPEAGVNLGPFERGASVTLGAALLPLALSRRRGLLGLAGAALGAYLALRGTTGHCAVYDLLDTGTAGDDDERLSAGAHRDASSAAVLTIARPPAEVFAFWRQVENTPLFMERIAEARPLGDGRSLWAAWTADDRLVEWEAELVEEKPAELLVWRAVPGSGVHHQVAASFHPAPDGGTEVRLEVELSLAGDRVGRALERVFGHETDYPPDQDLMRLRELLEAPPAAPPPPSPS